MITYVLIYWQVLCQAQSVGWDPTGEHMEQASLFFKAGKRRSDISMNKLWQPYTFLYNACVCITYECWALLI
jgi:hypothetical protein